MVCGLVVVALKDGEINDGGETWKRDAQKVSKYFEAQYSTNIILVLGRVHWSRQGRYF